MSPRAAARVTVLAGGVGGAKVAQGMYRATSGLAVIVNTGDDAEIYGLRVSPDLDTVLYTLSGLADPRTGWGIDGDSRAVMDQLASLGEDAWFTLGDRDLATHVLRSRLLRDGVPLSEVTRRLAVALGVDARVMPMTDDRVATLLDTPTGRLDFQEYFVGRGHRDRVDGVVLDGIASAVPAPGVLDALVETDLVVVAPSNPFVSIGPILAVPGVRETLSTSTAPRVAVSPVVGGKALKGPAADMLAAMGHEVSALGVARLYAGLVDVMCIDRVDRDLAGPIGELGMRVLVTDTVLGGAGDRERFARELLVQAVG